VTHFNNVGSAENNNPQKDNAQIPDAFKRLFQFVSKDKGVGNGHNSSNEMHMRVTTRPNPFNTCVTLDVMCEQNKHIIVRMFDEAGKIIKMLSWYVMKGSNVTSINELSVLTSGEYLLDIIDTDGIVLFSTNISKH
jgi:hypothetical protein